MSAAEYRSGEVVNITISGARVNYAADDGHISIRSDDGDGVLDLWLPADHPAVRIARVVPAEGEPQAGEVWADQAGGTYFAQQHQGSLNPVPWVELLPAAGGPSVKWLIVHNGPDGPIERVWRPDPPKPEPVDDNQADVPESKVWSCSMGCGYSIADGQVPDGEVPTDELIREHYEQEHPIDPRCPDCDEPLALIESGAVGHVPGAACAPDDGSEVGGGYDPREPLMPKPVAPEQPAQEHYAVSGRIQGGMWTVTCACGKAFSGFSTRAQADRALDDHADAVQAAREVAPS